MPLRRNKVSRISAGVWHVGLFLEKKDADANGIAGAF